MYVKRKTVRNPSLGFELFFGGLENSLRTSKSILFDGGAWGLERIFAGFDHLY